MPVDCCLLSAGAAFVFDCFFLASPLCTPSTFSLGLGACCLFDVFVSLDGTADLLFSSVAATFLAVAVLFDAVG